MLTGSGSTSDPWAVPLTGAGRALELVVSVGALGGALGGAAARLVPPALAAVTDLDDSSEVTTELLVTVLTGLARLDPAVAAVARRAVDPATSLTALRTAVVGTDGLVPAAAQHGLGSAAATLNGLGNLALPGQFVDSHLAAGAPPAAGRIFVRTDVRGTAPWPGETATRTVRLTAPGLPPDAFDLTGLPAAGPWFVVLPTRLGTGAADAGHAEQVARLRRVVDALRVARGAGPLAVIAHGPAGHVARAVAAQPGAGVTHLTLLGTAVSGTPSAWPDAPAAGDGLRLLQALRELTGAAPGDLGEADELLNALIGVSDGPPPELTGSLAVAAPYPIGDVAAPAGLAALPGSVAVRTVAANLDGDGLDLALGRLFAALLSARVSGGGSSAEEVRIGVRGNPTAVTANGIRTEISFALDAITLPLEFGDDALPELPAADPHPRLGVQLRLDRPTGWLVGGPSGVTATERRDPRLRAVDVELTVDLVSGSARCTMLLHDAAAFGIARARWPLALSLDPAADLSPHLTQEDRLLLGELADALGPRPASGALRALMDGLVALGLGQLGSDLRFTFEVDPVEQLLVDARSALPRLTATGRTPLAAALAGLTGGSATAGAATLPLGDGLTLSVDLGTGAAPIQVALATAPAGLTVAGGVNLGGSVAIDTAGGVALALTVGLGTGEGPNGRLGFTVALDTRLPVPLTAALTRTGGAEGIVRSVPLLPTTDVTGPERLITAMVPGELDAWRLEFAAREVAALAPLLQVIGLRDPASGRVRHPARRGRPAGPPDRHRPDPRCTDRAGRCRHPPQALPVAVRCLVP